MTVGHAHAPRHDGISARGCGELGWSCSRASPGIAARPVCVLPSLMTPGELMGDLLLQNIVKGVPKPRASDGSRRPRECVE